MITISISQPSDSAMLISDTVPSFVSLSVSPNKGNSSSLSPSSEISSGGAAWILSVHRARGFSLEA